MEIQYANKISDVLNFNVNYTLTETEGGDLRRIPKHAYRIGVAYSLTNNWVLSSDFSRTGERLAIDSMTTLEAYSLLDIRVQYTLQNPDAVLFVNLTNALNENYIEFLNYSTRGRNIMVGFRWLP